MKSQAKPKPALQFLELLEPRIAPAAISFVAPSVGTPLIVKAGEGLSTSNGSGQLLMQVDAGQALVFTTDLNHDGSVNPGEITGISAGPGLKLTMFTDLNGSIVTNLDTTTGTLTDSDGDISNGLDGKIVLNNQIASVTLRMPTTAQLGTAYSAAPTSFSLNGDILAGAGLGSLNVDTTGISANILPQIGFIKTGTKTSGQWFSFGYGADGANHLLDQKGNDISVRNQTVQFIAGSGQTGGDVGGVSVGTFTASTDPAVLPVFTPTKFTLMGIETGDGGVGARGGDIKNVTIFGDVGGLKLTAGDGGAGTMGGGGGNIYNFKDLGSLNGEYILRTGDGGEGFLGAAGKAGDLTLNGIQVDGLVSVGLGNGGNSLGNAGSGTSLVSGVFTSQEGAATGLETVKLVGTYRDIGAISTTGVVDFNGDGISDVIAITSNPDRLFVHMSGTGEDVYLDNISYSPLDTLSSGVVVQDFNHDGNLDIVSASSYIGNTTGILAYLGDGQGGFSSPRFSPFAGNGTTTGLMGSITDIAALSLSTALDPHGDRIPDLAIMTVGTAGKGVVNSAVLQNVGDGYFYLNQTPDASSKSTGYISTGENTYSGDWVMKSFATTEGGSDEALGFVAKEGTQAGAMKVARFIATTGVFSTSSASITMPGPTLMLPNGFAALDLNGDNAYDIVATNSNSWGSLVPYQVTTFQGAANGSITGKGITTLGDVKVMDIVSGTFKPETLPGTTVGSFIKNTSTGYLSLGATTYEGGNPNQDVSGLAYSGTGTFLAFSTDASNVLPLDAEGKPVDTGGYEDVFTQQVGVANSTSPAMVSSKTVTVAGVTTTVYGDGDSSNPDFNPANSSKIVFQTDATNLAAGDANGKIDILLKSGNTFQIISSNELGGAGNGDSTNASFSTSGNYVVFQSDASNLISGDIGQYTSSVVDSTGKTHIAYYDKSGGDLKYAVGSGSSFQCVTVDQANDVGLYTSIALTSAGLPVISYYDATNQDLKVASFDGTSWNPITPVPTPGVDDGKFTSLVLDASDDARIVFYDAAGTDLAFVSQTGGVWSGVSPIDTVGNVGQYASLAYDSAGDILHTSYYDATGGGLKYAQSAAGGAWVTQVVDTTGTTGLHTSIAVQPTGKVGISYFDATNKAIRYAEGSSAGVFLPADLVNVDTAGGSVTTQSTSLKFDAAGNPMVSYAAVSTDGVNSILKFSARAGTAWAAQTADQAPGTGGYSSLALDGSGDPHISYYDSLDGSLKVAARTGTADWADHTIDSGDTDTNGHTDIFVKYVGTDPAKLNKVFLASLTSGGAPLDADSYDPVIVESGGSIYVAFTSAATNANGSPGDATTQIFVKNVLGGELQLVSSAAVAGDADSAKAAFSHDASQIAFQSTATNLGGSVDGTQQIYVKQWLAGTSVGGVNDGTISVVSVNDTTAVPGNADSFNARFDSTGDKVVFASDATNLIASDTNGHSDIFVRDTALFSTILVSQSINGVQTTGNSDNPVFNPAASDKILFESNATNVIGGQLAVYVTTSTPDSTKVSYLKMNGYSASNKTSLGFPEVLFDKISDEKLVAFDAVGNTNTTPGYTVAGVVAAGPEKGGTPNISTTIAQNEVSENFLVGSGGGGFVPYQTGYSIVAGDGGHSYLGNGGAGGSIGRGGLVAGTDVNPTETASVMLSEFWSGAAGNAGNGFVNGGNGGAMSGVIAAGMGYSGGQGGIGLTGTGGTGGGISNFRFGFASLVGGDGGFGMRGGAGGSVIGGGKAGIADAAYNILNFQGGAGGEGILAGGAGGNLTNIVPLMEIDPYQAYSMHSGDGGDSIAGTAGAGGNISNTLPLITSTYTSKNDGSVSLHAGIGGDGLTGGAGGSISNFKFEPVGGNVLAAWSFIAGNGGSGTVVNGGAGGSISTVTAAGVGGGENVIGVDDVTGQVVYYSRFVAGEGGDSYGAIGGKGGGLSAIKSTATDASMVLAAGAAGNALLQGGIGGTVTGLFVNVGGSALTEAKMVLIAGAGGDAYSVIPGVPASTLIGPTPAERIANVKIFGGKNGIGGAGGDITNVTQPNAVLGRIDLIAGNGGSTLNYGTTFPADKTPVGRGGSITGVKLTTDIGDMDQSHAIKAYASDFVQNTVLNNPGTPIDYTTGNTGLVAGAAGFVKDGKNTPNGVNGSVSTIAARNIMSMVAGSVDRIAAITSLGSITLQSGGALGAYKILPIGPQIAPIEHSQTKPLYLNADGITESSVPVVGGRLMDGAIFTKTNSSGYPTSGRLFTS